jgi:hypothetical protein
LKTGENSNAAITLTVGGRWAGVDPTATLRIGISHPKALMRLIMCLVLANNHHNQYNN